MLRDIIDFSLKAHCSNTIAFGMRRADGTSDAANPIRHEAHILKAFHIEGSQAGGLPSFAQEFCRARYSCNCEDSITGPA